LQQRPATVTLNYIVSNVGGSCRCILLQLLQPLLVGVDAAAAAVAMPPPAAAAAAIMLLC
jgi:hypothetical protein